MVQLRAGGLTAAGGMSYGGSFTDAYRLIGVYTRRDFRVRQGPTGASKFHPVFHRPLHLLERAHLDLAHALARDAELRREFLERDRIFGQPARLDGPRFVRIS